MVMIMNDVLNTKFGRAKIYNGYYIIISRKDGNHGKRLHRLIFEDFYGPIPDRCDIHHKDGDKLNNCIMNLQILTHSQHKYLHKISAETCEKISRAQNTTGYYRVRKHKDSSCKQGFIWEYQYYDNGKRKSIKRIDIDKLEQKVKDQGLPWKKIENGDDKK